MKQLKCYETAHADILDLARQDILTASESGGILKIGDCGEGITLTWND